MAREWTDEDVERWIELIKREDPQLWDRYIEGEKTHHAIEPDDGDAMDRLAHRKLFPDASPGSLGTLTGLLRAKVRAELNLKWPYSKR
jgi:hypothetical protein